MTDEDLHCKIYVNTDAGTDELLHQLSTDLSGRIIRKKIISDDLTVFLDENDEYDPAQSRKSDGFLYFKFLLDVFPIEGVSRGAYVDTVARLLEAFWSHGFSAIAACDFESELPRNGGIS